MASLAKAATVKRIAPTTRNGRVRASGAVVHNGTIYLSGQVGNVGGSEKKSVAKQTEECLEKIEDLLSKCGSDKHCILSATVWLKSMDDFAEMNSVWDHWVSQEHAPARACVEARLARPELLVEIRATAFQK